MLTRLSYLRSPVNCSNRISEYDLQQRYPDLVYGSIQSLIGNFQTNKLLFLSLVNRR